MTRATLLQRTGDPRARAAAHRDRRRRGFTLIEVLGAIFLTSVVIAVAVGFYMNLSNASSRAVDSMREGIEATAVLDRIARDLSGATLLARAEDVDPLAHPWYFTAAELGGSGGADSLKFISRSQRPTASAEHVSDLAQVAYFTTLAEDGSTTLHRWSAPSLPEGYDPAFPDPDAPGSFVLAEGLRGVQFRFLGEDGAWADAWDSTQLERSGLLPAAVEVSVFTSGGDAAARAGDAELELPEEQWPVWSRQVVIYQRPLDLDAVIEAAVAAREGTQAGGATALAGGDGVELDENGNPIVADPNAPPAGDRSSVGACVRANFDACVGMFGNDECTVWSNIDNLPIGDFGGFIPPDWNCR